MKGYVQIPGLDFTDSFAPVATDASMHVIFALSLYKWDKSDETDGFVKSLMSKLFFLKEKWKSKYTLNVQVGFQSLVSRHKKQ